MFEYAMTADTLSRLREAGWHEARRVDIADQLAAIANAGLESSAAAEAFLSEFAGLRPVQREAGDWPASRMLFDAAAAVDEIGPEWITACYAPAAETSLTPIGLAHNTYMMLMIDSSGWLYGGWDQDLWRFGPLFEGLNRLMAGESGEPVDTG